MDKRLLTMAVMGAMAAPGMALLPDVRARRESPMGDWLRANGKLKARSKRVARDASRLQLRGWPETPCEAPEGYFWHRATGDEKLYYLLKTPPGERTVEYDERHDRSIIRSGWGYVKPTYAPGDVR